MGGGEVALAVDLVRDDAEIIVSFCPVCWGVGRAFAKRGVYRRDGGRLFLDVGEPCPRCGSGLGTKPPLNDMYDHVLMEGTKRADT